jgi:DnaJ family protein A protein 2
MRGTLYDALKVPPTANPNEIKIAYRQRILKAHPDKGGRKEFAQRINAAYQTLSNPALRKEYDTGLGSR